MGSGFRLWSLGFRGLGFRVYGLGLRVQGLGFSIQVSGFRLIPGLLLSSLNGVTTIWVTVNLTVAFRWSKKFLTSNPVFVD